MKSLDCKECSVHVLVCTNERIPIKASCKKVGGQELYAALKQKLKDENLYDTHWITRTGCLGFCNEVGAVVTIYRKGQEPQWFTDVTSEDFDTIWKEIIR
jgi:(2Fe-2S) ferredoxin